MKHDDSAQITRSLTISISASIVLLAAGIFIIDSVTTGKALEQVTGQLIRLIFFISLGIFLGLVIEDKGWTRYLAIFSAPVFRYARLGQRCSAAFGTAIFSGVAANAMLAIVLAQRSPPPPNLSLRKQYRYGRATWRDRLYYRQRHN